MTYSMTYFSTLPRSLTLVPALALLLTTPVGCTTSASTESAEPNSAEAPPPNEPEEVTSGEEVAPVAACHTDAHECALSEPLPPGAACFCRGQDGGAQEAGIAGE